MARGSQLADNSHPPVTQSPDLQGGVLRLKILRVCGKLVLQTVVRESVRFREAWSFAKPITSYDPKGSGAEDYRAVTAEILSTPPCKSGL